MKSLLLANSLATLGVAVAPQLHTGLPHGSLVLGNADLFTQGNVQVEVSATAYGIGYADPNRNKLMQLLNFICPPRPGARSVKVTQYDEHEAFETVAYKDTQRAELGDFRTVRQRTSSKVTREVPNRGLAIVLDKDQLKGNPQWQQMHTAYLIDLLTRASVQQAVTLYTAAATGVSQTWSDSANPDLLLRALNVNTLAAATGFSANRAVFGESADLLRLQSYAAQSAAQGFAGSQAVTPEAIATRIGLDRVLMSAERYNVSGTKTQFIGSKVLLFSAQDAASPEDNSNLVRHVSDTDAGGAYAVYVIDSLKRVTLVVENYELLQVQHTSGIALVTAAAS